MGQRGQRGQRRSDMLYTLPERGHAEDDLRLLALSCNRYGQLKTMEAPDFLMDVEKMLIWKRLLNIFRVDVNFRQ
ncbi:MAG: hypothetical protein PHC68_14015 [Syntrophorhabdaceae bacterium]|nr:hypothetical protein [Syntrophorhabdaceae bacterium]